MLCKTFLQKYIQYAKTRCKPELSDDAREWALEFSAEVGGKSVHGIDLVSLNEAGLISEFTVLARPPNAVAALKDEMMRRVPVRLATLKAKQALGLVG